MANGPLWIHPQVLASLEQHEPVNVVRRTIIQHESPDDIQLLMCYAVHYGHNDWMLNGPLADNSVFSPFLTAIYQRAHGSLYVLLDRLQDRYRNWTLAENGTLAYWMAYGKIEGGELQTAGGPVSLWDAVLEMDDPVSLEILRGFCFSDQKTLARLAQEKGAKKCYEVIKQKVWPEGARLVDSLSFWCRLVRKEGLRRRSYETESSGLDGLNRIVQRVCSYQGMITPVIIEDALLLWASFKMKNTEKWQFLTLEDEALIQSVLSGKRENLTEFCREEFKKSQSTGDGDGGNVNVTWCDTLHSRVIAECWAHVLNDPDLDGVEASRAQQQLSIRFVKATEAPELQSRVCGEDQIPPTHFEHVRLLLNHLTSLLCARTLPSIHFDFRWLSVGCVVRQHLNILVAYQYHLFPFAQWSGADCRRKLEHSKCMSDEEFEAFQPIITLLPQPVYESYRTDLTDRSCISDSKDLQFFIIALVFRGTTKYVDNFDKVRPLTELCRLTVYQHVRGGQLPDFVRSSNLPRRLKEYLTLWAFKDL